jgi:hypothetical protein
MTKIVEHYNQMVENSDWDSAEVLAMGARAKFGDNEPVVHVMNNNVKLARRMSEQTNEIDVFQEQSLVRALPDRPYLVDQLPARCRLGDDADIYEIKKYLNFKYGITSTIEISHKANDAMIIRASIPTNQVDPPSPKSPDSTTAR